MALFNRKGLLDIYSCRYLVTALAGALFAFIPWKIMDMDFRYGLAASAALICITLAMIFIHHIENFLIYAFLFHIPFSIFGKWLFRQDVVAPARGINFGLTEILLIIAYLVWFAQIFIARNQPLPKLRGIDVFVIILLTFKIMSLGMAQDKLLGSFDVIYTIKHMMMYFFLSHKVDHKHLKWIIALFLFAILAESAIAFFERITGYVNIGSIKGNIHSADFGTQYVVPGIENELRASGTTNDSHTLGLYFAMLLSLPFVLIARPGTKNINRVLLGSVLFIGLLGLILTFSRSGWLGFTVGAAIASWIIIVKWRQGQIIAVLLIILLGASCCYPKAYSHIYRRVFQAPSGLISARFEMHYTALDIWSNNFLLGCGPGNYITALHDPDTRAQHLKNTQTALPVHNLYLYTLAELGLCGAVAFLGIIAASLRVCWRTARDKDDSLVRAMALATLAGLMGYLVDGFTDPMFREAVPNAQLWTFIALCASFPRLINQSNHEKLIKEQCEKEKPPITES